MNPDITRLTRTNIVPSDSEARDIRNYILELEKNPEKRIEIVETYRSVISAVRKLTPELVAEIFGHCIQGPSRLPLKSSESPLSLTHICSAWRNVGLGTPRLWNNISLVLSENHRVPTLRLMFRSVLLIGQAITLFSRSHMSGLVFKLKVDERLLSPLSVLNLDPVLVLIADWAPWIRELDLTVPIDHVINLSPCSLDRLETLKITLIESFNEIPDESMEFFTATPCLHSFTLSSQEFEFEAPRLLCLPWSQLTRLHIIDTYFPHHAYHEILRQCSNLIECTLCLGEWTPGLWDGLTIVLPNLRVLHLKVGYSEQCGRFIQSLEIPNLMNFELSLDILYLDHSISWSDPTFASIPALHNLQRLYLSGVDTLCPEFMDFLQKVPSLVELGLVDSVALDDHSLLIKLSSEHDFLPKLENVIFSTTAETWDEFSGVITFMESRWWPGSSPTGSSHTGSLAVRLKRVELQVDRIKEIAEAVRLRFDKFIEQGLDLTYHRVY